MKAKSVSPPAPRALTAQEWACNKHGTQFVRGIRKGATPRCKWCGNHLTLNTWTMRG